MVPVGAVERNVKARCQVRVPVVLIARGAEPGSAKCAFGHYLLPPRRLAISFGNAGYPDKIPTGADVQPRFGRVSARHLPATPASPVFSPVRRALAVYRCPRCFTSPAERPRMPLAALGEDVPEQLHLVGHHPVGAEVECPLD